MIAITVALVSERAVDVRPGCRCEVCVFREMMNTLGQYIALTAGFQHCNA
jgi:hypothetical protein